MFRDADTQSLEYEQLLQQVQDASSQFDMLRLLKKVTALYGFRAFMVLKMPNGTPEALQAASVITSWPAELLSLYDSEGLISHNGAIRHLRMSSLPVRFNISDLSKDRSDGKAEMVNALFERFEMSKGAFFPACDPSGERGGIGFSGNRADLDSNEMAQMHMISTHAFDRLYQVGRTSSKVGDDLTLREIDCLNWTAAGKTSSEISHILNLSEHTVNHYLNRATRKLDTVNRTQAVAKALRMGIIA